MKDLVTIVTLIIPFVFVIAVLWIQFIEKHKRRQLLADLYLKALEKGQSVPEDLFAEPKKKFSSLNTVIICIAVGIALSLCAWLIILIPGANMKIDALIFFKLIGSLGIIPFLIGVAFLIIHFFGKKNSTTENAK